MPRPIWTGSIGFGLVNVPVKLVSATSQKEVHFHMLHDEDGGRIQFKRVCSVDGKEVPYEHIIKGYEIRKGRYVPITPDELKAAAPKATRSIDIEDFVDLANIDPIYYETTYYLVPDKGAARPYALLLEAMKRTGKVGIGRMVLRTRQYLCAVRPMGGALAVSTMLFADEVIGQDQLDALPGSSEKPRDKELQMAEQLVQSLATPFEPDKYKDEYRKQVEDLIAKKAEGEEIGAPAEEAEPGGRVINLMEALQASLAAASGAKKAAPAASSADHDKPAHGEVRHKPAHRAAAREKRAPARKRKSSGSK